MPENIKKLTKLEIIDETIDYYKTHKRSITGNGTCLYVGIDNNRCAVSRCVIEEKLNIFANHEGESIICVIHNEDNIDSLLKEEYHGHDITFWENMQELHDCDSYWDINSEIPFNELTHQGRARLYNIKNEYLHDKVNEVEQIN